jgi:hypothetical protein
LDGLKIENAMSDSLAKELQWGGVTLALGSMCFVLGIILFLRVFYGEWDTTMGESLAQTADRMRERWNGLRVVWLTELVGALLLTFAGFLLQRRPQTSCRWLPVSLAWIVVSVGSIFVAVNYAFVLGSYPHALAIFSEAPAVFTTIRGGALFLHFVGSILQLLGLLTVLIIEFRWKGRKLSDRLVHLGVGVMILIIAASAGGFIDTNFTAAAVYLASALLGVSIWMSEKNFKNIN